MMVGGDCLALRSGSVGVGPTDHRMCDCGDRGLG